jgi:hypothetical protein
MGAIDLEELHKKLEWPDRKSLLKRMEQGPIGKFIQKLMMMGLPEPFAQFFQQISGMEEKDIEKGLENGSLPTIPALIQAFLQSGGQLEDPPNEKEDAEIQETLAKVQKIIAETALIQEKIRTEETNQEVSRAGIGFDEKKLKLEEAETIQGIKNDIEQLRVNMEQFLIGQAADLKRESIKAQAATLKNVTQSDSGGPKKSSTKRGSGAPREKGLKSNNKTR